MTSLPCATINTQFLIVFASPTKMKNEIKMKLFCYAKWVVVLCGALNILGVVLKVDEKTCKY